MWKLVWRLWSYPKVKIPKVIYPKGPFMTPSVCKISNTLSFNICRILQVLIKTKLRNFFYYRTCFLWITWVSHSCFLLYLCLLYFDDYILVSLCKFWHILWVALSFISVCQVIFRLCLYTCTNELPPLPVQDLLVSSSRNVTEKWNRL